MLNTFAFQFVFRSLVVVLGCRTRTAVGSDASRRLCFTSEGLAPTFCCKYSAATPACCITDLIQHHTSCTLCSLWINWTRKLCIHYKSLGNMKQSNQWHLTGLTKRQSISSAKTIEKHREYYHMWASHWCAWESGHGCVTRIPCTHYQLPLFPPPWFPALFHSLTEHKNAITKALTSSALHLSTAAKTHDLDSRTPWF